MNIGKLNNISQSEIDSLQLFVVRANELLERRMFAEGIPELKIDTTVKLGKEITVETNFPDEEDFRSALLAIRLFYSNDEPTQFNKICNILYKKLVDNDLKDRVNQVRECYKGNLNQVVINGTGNDKVTNDKLICLYLNSRYFHSDSKKSQELECLENSVPHGHIEFELRDALLNAAECIFIMKHIIEESLVSVT
jgi:hypothetical protein